jgi:hypothetical protein
MCFIYGSVLALVYAMCNRSQVRIDAFEECPILSPYISASKLVSPAFGMPRSSYPDSNQQLAHAHL